MVGLTDGARHGWVIESTEIEFYFITDLINPWKQNTKKEIPMAILHTVIQATYIDLRYKCVDMKFSRNSIIQPGKHAYIENIWDRRHLWSLN